MIAKIFDAKCLYLWDFAIIFALNNYTIRREGNAVEELRSGDGWNGQSI